MRVFHSLIDAPLRASPIQPARIASCQCARRCDKPARVRGDAEPFDLDGDDDVGVVLVHGFTGTPFEVGYLGRALAKERYTVSAPRLPGHGTSLDDLDRTRWEDWVGTVENATDRLAARCRTVA